MHLPSKELAAANAGTVLASGALAQSAAPFLAPIESEPAPRLIVEPPLPGPLANGLAFIPYRAENVRILPVAGESARKLSPQLVDPVGNVFAAEIVRFTAPRSHP
jgi:hypothetical protein